MHQKVCLHGKVAFSLASRCGLHPRPRPDSAWHCNAVECKRAIQNGFEAAREEGLACSDAGTVPGVMLWVIGMCKREHK